MLTFISNTMSPDQELSSSELILRSAETGGSEGIAGHTVDRWKGKEAVLTIAGYVQALSLLSLAAVESVENNLSDIPQYEHVI